MEVNSYVDDLQGLSYQKHSSQIQLLNSEMNKTFLQIILRGLKNIILTSESILEMHIYVDLGDTDWWLSKGHVGTCMTTR